MYDLTKSASVDTSYDGVVIQHFIEDIPGGRALDVTGITDTTLKAGRVIIEKDSDGTLLPLGITSGSYDSLPASHTYKGILYVSIPTDKPGASIMVRGTVNEAAAVASGLPTYPAGAKTALSLIRFTQA